MTKMPQNFHQIGQIKYMIKRDRKIDARGECWGVWGLISISLVLMEVYYFGSGLYELGQFKGKRAVCGSFLATPHSCDTAYIVADMHKVDGPMGIENVHVEQKIQIRY